MDNNGSFICQDCWLEFSGDEETTNTCPRCGSDNIFCDMTTNDWTALEG